MWFWGLEEISEVEMGLILRIFWGFWYVKKYGNKNCGIFLMFVFERD